MEYSDLKKEIELAASSYSQYQLRKLRLIISDGIRRRYDFPRIPRYGDLNMAFTDEELTLFLSKIRNKKLLLLFKCQAYLGLRIGEAIRINLKEIDFNTQELVFESEKVRTIAKMRIPDILYKEIQAWIMDHKFYVYRSGGYLFYKDNDNNRNGLLHVEKHYVIKAFNRIRKAAGLDEVYGHAKGGRPLYRLSTHSLRRYAATRFHQVSKDIVKTSRFLRHQNIKNTIKYVCTDRRDIYADMDAAFDMPKKILMPLIAQG